MSTKTGAGAELRAAWNELVARLEAGRDARLLRFDSSEEAFRTFFGLVVRDVQIRLLLGDGLKLATAQIEAEARRATEQFLSLYER